VEHHQARGACQENEIARHPRFDALNSSLRQVHRRALHTEAGLNRLTNLATNLVPVVPGGGLMFRHALLHGMLATAPLLGTEAAFAFRRARPGEAPSLWSRTVDRPGGRFWVRRLYSRSRLR
jgi:hypothetical protein